MMREDTEDKHGDSLVPDGENVSEHKAQLLERFRSVCERLAASTDCIVKRGWTFQFATQNFITDCQTHPPGEELSRDELMTVFLVAWKNHREGKEKTKRGTAACQVTFDEDDAGYEDQDEDNKNSDEDDAKNENDFYSGDFGGQLPYTMKSFCEKHGKFDLTATLGGGRKAALGEKRKLLAWTNYTAMGLGALGHCRGFKRCFLRILPVVLEAHMGGHSASYADKDLQATKNRVAIYELEVHKRKKAPFFTGSVDAPQLAVGVAVQAEMSSYVCENKTPGKSKKRAADLITPGTATATGSAGTCPKNGGSLASSDILPISADPHANQKKKKAKTKPSLSGPMAPGGPPTTTSQTDTNGSVGNDYEFTTTGRALKPMARFVPGGPPNGLPSILTNIRGSPVASPVPATMSATAATTLGKKKPSKKSKSATSSASAPAPVSSSKSKVSVRPAVVATAIATTNTALHGSCFIPIPSSRDYHQPEELVYMSGLMSLNFDESAPFRHRQAAVPSVVSLDSYPVQAPTLAAPTPVPDARQQPRGALLGHVTSFVSPANIVLGKRSAKATRKNNWADFEIDGNASNDDEDYSQLPPAKPDKDKKATTTKAQPKKNGKKKGKRKKANARSSRYSFSVDDELEALAEIQAEAAAKASTIDVVDPIPVVAEASGIEFTALAHPDLSRDETFIRMLRNFLSDDSGSGSNGHSSNSSNVALPLPDSSRFRVISPLSMSSEPDRGSTSRRPSPSAGDEVNSQEWALWSRTGAAPNSTSQPEFVASSVVLPSNTNSAVDLIYPTASSQRAREFLNRTILLNPTQCRSDVVQITPPLLLRHGSALGGSTGSDGRDLGSGHQVQSASAFSPNSMFSLLDAYQIPATPAATTLT